MRPQDRPPDRSTRRALSQEQGVRQPRTDGSPA